MASLYEGVKEVIPKPTRKSLKWLYYFVLDAFDLLLGQRGKLTPPRRLIYVTVEIGRGDFKKIGQEFFDYFIKLAKIKQTDQILEVGCGIGRMAVPLTNFLTQKGGYQGFDVSRTGIKWCTNKITPRFPNFRFKAVNIYNQHYNPEGEIQPEDLNFPYDDETFDFVFLTSVFTHMLSKETENYLEEIFRVLKKGGKCLATFLLINDEYQELLRSKKTPVSLIKLPKNGCYTSDPDDPESFTGFDETWVRELYRNKGFKLMEPIRYGSWCGRTNFLSYQDIVLAKRP